jgi:hypothetical protein
VRRQPPVAGGDPDVAAELPFFEQVLPGRRSVGRPRRGEAMPGGAGRGRSVERLVCLSAGREAPNADAVNLPLL